MLKKYLTFILSTVFILSTALLQAQVELMVLGTIQDAGLPHLGCKKSCCNNSTQSKESKYVVSLGLIDHTNQKAFIMEATPHITQQWQLLSGANNHIKPVPDGIFLTHAHIGHYTGLMYLGKEALNSKEVLVYAMPKMATFLETNGPWSQLVTMNNIKLTLLQNEKNIELTNQLSVKPILVPHRDEFSETVGYLISGPQKKALFIPDIDKWQKWSYAIVEWIKEVDFAFLDATFYSGKEINHRDVSQIPHPMVKESMHLFKPLSKKDKNKVYFIHFNHTNPLLNQESDAYKEVIKQGYHVAQKGQKIRL